LHLWLKKMILNQTSVVVVSLDCYGRNVLRIFCYDRSPNNCHLILATGCKSRRVPWCGLCGQRAQIKRNYNGSI
jgi:hypothetical protein